MISSDEEEVPGGDTPVKSSQISAPSTPASNNSQSPSHSEQAECPESPFIPNIPISNRADQAKGRVGKMEGKVSCSSYSYVRIWKINKSARHEMWVIWQDNPNFKMDIVHIVTIYSVSMMSKYYATFSNTACICLKVLAGLRNSQSLQMSKFLVCLVNSIYLCTELSFLHT